jgi:glycogen phosphorylase
MGSATTVRTGLTSSEIKQAFRDNLRAGLGRLETFATKHDLYVALALTIRDRLFQHTVESMENYGGANARRVAYLLAEYLRGPYLANNLLNLGITEVTREALRDLGYDLDEILAQEEEPGLGNGGLGSKKTYDPRSYLTLAETAMAERVKQAVSDLRGTGKTMFAS